MVWLVNYPTTGLLININVALIKFIHENEKVTNVCSKNGRDRLLIHDKVKVILRVCRPIFLVAGDRLNSIMATEIDMARWRRTGADDAWFVEYYIPEHY